MFRLPIGDHLWLERFETRHAEALFALIERGRSDLERWSGIPDDVPNAIEPFREWLGRARDTDARDQSVTCGIWLRGEPVGLVALSDISPRLLSATVWGFLTRPRVVEVTREHGLEVVPAASDAAVRGLVSYAFAALGLERVEYACSTENVRSRKLAERLGLTYEGSRRSADVVGERFTDLEVYSALAGEWTATCERVLRVAVRRARAEDESWLRELNVQATGLAEAAPRTTWVVERRAALEIARESPVTAVLSRFAVADAAAMQGVGHRLFDVVVGDLRLAGVKVLLTRTGAQDHARHREFLARRGMLEVSADLWMKALA